MTETILELEPVKINYLKKVVDILENSLPVYSFELPVETPSNNVIKGAHFHAYRNMRMQWCLMVKSALQGHAGKNPPLEHSFLHIRRHCVGSLDWDNAYGGLKPLLDTLVVASARNPNGLGLIVDDNPKSMPFPPFLEQVKAKQKQGKTEIFIYDLKGL